MMKGRGLKRIEYIKVRCILLLERCVKSARAKIECPLHWKLTILTTHKIPRRYKNCQKFKMYNTTIFFAKQKLIFGLCLQWDSMKVPLSWTIFWYFLWNLESLKREFLYSTWKVLNSLVKAWYIKNKAQTWTYIIRI